MNWLRLPAARGMVLHELHILERDSRPIGCCHVIAGVDGGEPVAKGTKFFSPYIG